MTRREDILSTFACPAIPGLRVLPVVRYRLAFARAAAGAVRATKPGTMIAVDLPHALSRSEWLTAATGAFPNPSTLMIHQAPHTFAAPIVANDAACLALQAALDTGRPYCCVDDILPAETPDPGGELQDDESLPSSLESYFRAAWNPGGNHISARAARVRERLRQLAAQAENILFVCDWRLWPLVADAVESRTEPEREPIDELLCAIVPEDALLLWQAGFLDDLPALSLAGYSQRYFQKLEALHELVARVQPELIKRLRNTLSLATNMLEPALEEFGPSVARDLAAACLTFSKWGVNDLANGTIPQFGLLTANAIEPAPGIPFPLLDIFSCEWLYPYSQAETLRFCPRREAEVRRYWGPGWPPPLTRSEVAIGLSPDQRWSVGPHYRATAQAAEIMRNEARRLTPDLATDLFTPTVWIFCREGDGDHRSVPDVNAAQRRMQLSDLPDAANAIEEGGLQPDEIYTLSATRYVHGDTCPGVNHDIVSGIGLIYTGPHCGPERYHAVMQHGWATGGFAPSVDPSCDSEIVGFDLIERNIAFCIKYAAAGRGVVLLAHFEGFSPTAKLEQYAKARRVQIVPMPLTVIPRYLQMAVQRRIFLSKTMRWHRELGERIADRMVFWRIPDPDALRP